MTEYNSHKNENKNNQKQKRLWTKLKKKCSNKSHKLIGRIGKKCVVAENTANATDELFSQ